MRILPLFLLAFLLLASGSGARATAPSPASIRFVENKGQWPAAVRFRADVPGGAVFLTDAGLVYNWVDQAGLARAHDAADHPRTKAGLPARPGGETYRGHAIFVDFVGAASNTPQGAKPTVARHSYFLGNDPAKWAAGVRLFAEVSYQELYPGVGLRFYGDARGQLKYDVLVAPGADAGALRWRYRGTEYARPDAGSGDLRLGTSVGEIQEKAPLAYQLNPRTGQREAVACRYVRAADGTFRYALPAGYDAARPLVIDPSVVACTYSGSTSTVYGYCATTDAGGNLYTAGRSLAPGFPVSPGAYQASNRGLGDMALSKFNPTGTTLLWSTYLGGNSSDEPVALRTTPGGELWVLGDTGSETFPTTPGCFDPTYNGGFYDVTLSRLSANGAQLLASTLLGGAASENAADFVLDAAGTSCYVALTTRSADFPTTAGAFQRTPGGEEDAAVLRLNTSLSALAWSTRLGGTREDIAKGIALNRLGEPVVTGSTGGFNFPTTPGTLRPVTDRLGDGFVVRLRADGSGLVASTMVGVTNGADFLSFLALDPATDDVLVYGATEGMLSPTPGALSISAPPTGSIPQQVFISKISADLRTLRFTALVPPGTLARGAGLNERLTAFGLDECGNINGAALTYPGLPLVQPLPGGGVSGALYVFTMNPSGTALLFGSYYGPPNRVNALSAPHAHSISQRFDGRGRLAHVFCNPVDGTPFPTTPGAYAPTSRLAAGIGLDMVGTVLETGQAGAAPPRAALSAPDSLCLNTPLLPLNLSTGTQGFVWDFGDGSPPNTTRQPSHRYAAPGRYRVWLRALGGQPGCRGLTPDDTDSAVVVVLPALPRTLSPVRLLCDGQAVLDASAGPGVRYRWNTGATTPRLTVNAGGTYYVALSNGACTRTDTVRVLPPLTRLLAGPADTVLCGPAQLELRPLAGVVPPGSQLQWSTGVTTPTLLVSESGTYTLTVTTPDGCRLTAAQRVTIQASGLPPNVITPEATDALNATFVVPGLLPGTRVSFYSRWGRLVYRTDEYRNEWNAAGLSAGLYYYLVENPRLCQGPRLKGWVEVIR